MVTKQHNNYMYYYNSGRNDVLTASSGTCKMIKINTTSVLHVHRVGKIAHTCARVPYRILFLGREIHTVGGLGAQPPRC